MPVTKLYYTNLYNKLCIQSINNTNLQHAFPNAPRLMGVDPRQEPLSLNMSMERWIDVQEVAQTSGICGSIFEAEQRLMERVRVGM